MVTVRGLPDLRPMVVSLTSRWAAIASRAERSNRAGFISRRGYLNSLRVRAGGRLREVRAWEDVERDRRSAAVEGHSGHRKDEAPVFGEREAAGVQEVVV